MPRWFLYVAYSEIAAAAIGLASIGVLVHEEPGYSSSVSNILGLTFFLLAAFAGIQLARGVRQGVVLSLLVQALQIAAVSASWRFVAQAGAIGAVVFANTGIGIETGFEGRFAATIWHGGPIRAPGYGFSAGFGLWPGHRAESTVTITVNLIAAYSALRLWRHMRQTSRLVERGVVT